MTLYFDNASAMQILPEVEQYIIENTGFLCADREAYHQAGVETVAEIEKSRIIFANTLNVSTSTIRFISDETVLLNLLSTFLINNSFETIISYKDENPQLLRLYSDIAKKNNVDFRFIEQKEDSGIDLKHLKQVLKESAKAFVSLPHVNEVTGRLLPIRRVSELCEKYNAVFYCDISHSFARLEVDLSRIPVNIATFSSHKNGSIRGVKGMYIKHGKLNKKLFDNFYFVENQNVLSIKSFAVGVETLKQKGRELNKQVEDLKKCFFEKLKQKQIEYTSISESEEHFSPYFINIKFNVADFEAFCYKLDLNDVHIKPFWEEKQLLISFSPMNSIDEIDSFIDVCKNVLL